MSTLLEFFPEVERINLLDVGAAIGETPTYQPLIDVGVGRLYGFEPDAEACTRLNEQYGMPHRFFQCFVGDGRPAIFHRTNWALTGSLYPPNTPLLEKFHVLAEVTAPAGTQAVSTVRLDDIAEIDDVDFFKIDVQGGELTIFQNATRILANTLIVQTEVEFVEMYRGQPMFSDIDQCLRAQGFQFHTFLNFGSRAFKPLIANGNPHAGFRQYLWSDAVYVRDWMHLERLSESKLRNYAILAHDLLASFDLAHHVLEALDRKTGGNLATEYVRRLTSGAKSAP
jgi:FkbM family methyltransferase